jgi:large repetitive protein
VSTSGPNSCGTGSNYNDGGDVAWSNPTNIQANDAAYATVALPASKVSQELKAQNFGFAIPTDATITNVAFSYIRKASAAVSIITSVYMLDASGAIGLGDVSDGNGWAITDETISPSGDSAFWGLTLTPALVNSANFGLAIWAYNLVGTTVTASVEYVSCTITYTGGSADNYSGRGIARGIARGIFR